MTIAGISGAPVGTMSLFTDAERERRWNLVRALMDESGIDLLLVFPNWIPGDAMWIANQPGAVIFPREGEPQILLGGEDVALERNRPPGWIMDRQFISLSNSVYWGPAVAERLDATALAGKTIAIAGMTGDAYLHMHNPEGYLNYTTIQSIADVLPSSCRVVTGTPILSRARYIKSEEEITLIEASVRAGETVAEVIHRELRVGRPQAAAFIAGMTALADEGRIAHFGWCPGKWREPRPRLVMPPPGVVEEGLFVSAEIMVPVAGYMGQVAQVFVVGSANDEAKHLFEVNRAAFEAASSAMRPGATWGEVVAAAQESAKGTGCFIEFIMHGAGSGPLITPYNSVEPVKEDVVEDSTTFILKPCAVPNGTKWTARSMDVSWGDMVVVRPQGAERLGTRPFALLESM